MSTSTVDVLIVGAGPTGLILALELVAQGVSFRIIEKLPERSDKSRALVVHCRTLEVLSRHGVAEELMSRGGFERGISIYVNKKPIPLEMKWGQHAFDDTSYSNSLFVSQAETEQVLFDALAKHKITVERGISASNIKEDSDGVSVDLQNDAGTTESIRCKYVVGCDGAHSTVRHSTDIAFEGDAYQQDFILADVKIDWEGPTDKVAILFGEAPMFVAPLTNGLYRVVASRPGGHDGNEEPVLDTFRELVSQMGPGTPKLHDPVWLTRFHLHHRVASKYSTKRLFLAGDAAHVHSPAGGQGMNTGMQDAANLGWKLGSVLTGKASVSLLESYDAERRKVGVKLLQSTDRIFKVATMQSRLFWYFRNFMVKNVLPTVAPHINISKTMRFMSQLDIKYRNSPIVGTASKYKGNKIQGGDRAPDAKIEGLEGEKTLLSLCVGPNHHLILFSGEATDEITGLIDEFESLQGSYKKWMSIQKIAEQPSSDGSVYADNQGQFSELYGFKEPSYVLIRPDGHVAHIGPLTAKDELKTWLSSYMGNN